MHDMLWEPEFEILSSSGRVLSSPAARRGDPVAEEVGSPSQDGGQQHGDGLGPVPAVPAGSGAGRPPGSAGIEWIEGSADTGSVDTGIADARLTNGLRWSFELELGEVLA